MSTKQLTFTVNELDKLADYLDDYKKKIEETANELLGRMLREGEVTARILLTHVDTGKTMSTIMGYRNGNTGMILAGGNAIWVEFGTGVYAPGQTNYPKPVKGIVGHGEYGKGHGADPNGWFYKDEFGEWKHTFGIPANMFMYNTAEMLRREYAKMAKEIFSK